MSMGLGYWVGTAIFATIFSSVVGAQIAAKKFHPFLFWTVIVATTYDVRSSLRWAEALATDLGAPLIRFNAAGHAIVGQGNACIDGRITAFLITPLTPLLSGDC